MANNLRYHQLYCKAVEAFPQKLKSSVQEDVAKLWKEIKAGNKNYDTEFRKLEERATTQKSGFIYFLIIFKI